MTSNIKNILKRLEIADTGHYNNHFYVIPFANSNEYAKAYTKLDKNAINTEYPEFERNTNDSTIKVVNYFEIEEESKLYDLFLFANFEENVYYLKIKERDF